MQIYIIYLGLKRKWSKSRIAAEIGVSKSTVCREVRRNSKPDGSYVAHRPHDRGRLVARADSRRAAQGRHKHMQADHLQPRPCRQDGKLAGHMPHELKYNRRARQHRPTKATNIANRTSIHERPAEADGKRFGDWEMDTIVDAHGHAILTLTERSTNFILMERLKEGRKAVPTAKAVVRLLLPYRKHVKTITTDNGCEFAAHMEITKGLAVKGEGNAVVYFADSYSAWQKGAIENANKLIRKYIPKKADFSDYTDRYIKKVQYKLNSRPREKLNFDTPKCRFFNFFE